MPPRPSPATMRTAGDLADLVPRQDGIVSRVASGHDRIFAIAPVNTLSLVLSLSNTQVVDRLIDRTREVSRARAGSISIVPVGRPAEFQIHGPSRGIMLHIPWLRAMSWIEADFGAKLAGSELAPRLHCDDTRLARAIYRVAAADAESRDAALLEVVERLFTAHREDGIPREEFWFGVISPARLRRLSEFIDAHLDEELPLERLSREVGMSVFHFARGFKVATGVTPHAFIVGRRFERGLSLLAENELPVAAIARAVGFGHASHFARVVRERTGLAPSALRTAIHK